MPEDMADFAGRYMRARIEQPLVRLLGTLWGFGDRFSIANLTWTGPWPGMRVVVRRERKRVAGPGRGSEGWVGGSTQPGNRFCCLHEKL
jgi:hypothetical protein